jgi:hypothetical protein
MEAKFSPQAAANFLHKRLDRHDKVLALFPLTRKYLYYLDFVTDDDKLDKTKLERFKLDSEQRYDDPDLPEYTSLTRRHPVTGLLYGFDCDIGGPDVVGSESEYYG